ncbi:polysaccharide deacetylase family protein [Metabacillus sp. RGM 3146]|uniref:polysaccharide deacetylase family protein n=1 Tax=Metabacillus sp. RGM 3146 TaxID=3401092 RepID=UPI003B9C6459
MKKTHYMAIPLAAMLCFFAAGCQPHISLGTAADKQSDEKSNKPAQLEKKDTHKTDVKNEARAPKKIITQKPPKYEVSPVNWTIKPLDKKTNKKVALLTIDDAPDKHALEMAKTLKALNVKAIFFVNGHFIDEEKEKQVLKEIHDMGFVIGNHTYHHLELKGLPAGKQKEEILKLNEAVEKIIGEKPKFFRAPFGINTDVSRKLVADEKMKLMNWTFGYDWNKEYQNKEALTKIMKDTPYLANGSIILMHDRKWTSEALKDIVLNLKAKGFEIADPHTIKTD